MKYLHSSNDYGFRDSFATLKIKEFGGGRGKILPFFLGSQHFFKDTLIIFCNFFFKGGDFFAAFSILTCLETDFLRRVIFVIDFFFASWLLICCHHNTFFLNGCKNKKRDFYCVYYYRDDDDENVSLLKLSLF